MKCGLKCTERIILILNDVVLGHMASVSRVVSIGLVCNIFDVVGNGEIPTMHDSLSTICRDRYLYLFLTCIFFVSEFSYLLIFL